MEELVRLTGSDYAEAIDFLDLVFSQAGRPHHFEKMLPRMCAPDDEHMRRHFAVRVDGRIAAMLGVYPLPVVIAGQRFLFATTGNVATHHRYEGRGYAHRLLNRAMRELDDIGADASRLGGFRQRYNRFGFETAGSVYCFQIDRANVKDLDARPVRFSPVESDDEAALAAIQAIQTRAPFYVDRGTPAGFALTAAAWENRLHAAYDESGLLMGALCVSSDGSACAEVIARDGDSARAMVIQWIRQRAPGSLSVPLPPWDTEGIRRLGAFCQSLTIQPASLFRITSWRSVADALCRVRSGLSALPEGAFTLKIADGPTLRFAARRGEARCEETSLPPDLTLSALDAARYLFGPQAPWTVASVTNPLAAALLPLPLSWCGQDRV